MAQYILAYHDQGGKKPESTAAGLELMEKWKAWINFLGKAVINPGTPLGPSKTVSKSGVVDNGGANPLHAFSVIEAKDIEDAVQAAQSSPYIEFEQGTIEVAEMKQMGG